MAAAKLIGLTGGIGSGKTTVANLFAKLGIKIFNADAIAKELRDLAINKEQIIQYFGKNILNKDILNNAATLEINVKLLRQRIINNNQDKQYLEELLHPQIRQVLLERVANCTDLYCIAEIPLLVETGFWQLVDRILVVDCDIATQITRLQERDHMEYQEITGIINSQATREQRLKLAHDVIVNSSSISVDQLEKAVLNLHNKYLLLFGNK